MKDELGHDDDGAGDEYDEHGDDVPGGEWGPGDGDGGDGGDGGDDRDAAA